MVGNPHCIRTQKRGQLLVFVVGFMNYILKIFIAKRVLMSLYLTVKLVGAENIWEVIECRCKKEDSALLNGFDLLPNGSKRWYSMSSIKKAR